MHRTGCMKHFRYCSVLLLSALLGVTLGGCNSGHASDTKLTVFRYAYSPQAEQLEGGSLRIDLVRAYLEKQLHMPVEVVRVEGYAPTIEAMRADKVDMFSGSSLTYLLAAQTAGAQAIAARGYPDGSIGGYRSVIAVPKDSPIHSMQDLKAHAKDLVFAFAEPASTSGYLYPRVGLMSNGIIDPDKDFKKVVFTGNHLATAMTIKAGKVDAGAFMQTIVTRLVETHKMSPGDVRVIWTSDLIPNGPYAVRRALPEQFKKELQTALVQMPTRDPELWAHLSSLVRTPASGSVIVPVTDASYDGLRKYASQVKDFNFAGSE
jgi:phosphonate transport system substrate-binding protein